jgi:Zn-dependent protease with chaperone function
MDFFEQQELARRATRRLVVLFVVAVLAIVIAVNVVLALLFSTFVAPGALPPAGIFAAVTLAIVALIGGGTAWELNALRAGGQVVAKMVGAREVDPTTRDLLDRRFFNVVEEMAIASGVPVPRVFVMDEENSINAFAAGNSIQDAVVAVTRGTLTRLSRDELQGVVAHEFAHVLNGDMRLNTRLVGVLFGLLLVAVAGRFLLQVGGRSRGGGGRGSGGAVVAVLLVGVACWLLGYIGVFFGRMIKAAVSRQREYLADASAVQFTRNPDGIGGALRKIGGLSASGTLGSRIEHPQAESLSHMFLGAARPSFMRGLFATHPPIEDRLRRLYGRKIDFLPAPEDALALAMDRSSTAQHEPAAQTAAMAGPVSQQSVMDAFADGTDATVGAAQRSLSPLAGLLAGGALASAVTTSIGTVRGAATAEPQDDEGSANRSALHDAATDATEAPLLALALLVESESDLREQQRAMVAEAYGARAARRVDDLHHRAQALSPGSRQPLIDVAMPALRKLPPAERARLLKIAHLLIAADGRITVREFLLYTILKRRLGPAAGQEVVARFKSAAALPSETSLVLSLVAMLRLPERPEHAFNAGALLLPGTDVKLLGHDRVRLDEVAAALDRLNELMPLAKPQLIKAVTASAFVDGATNWKAASALRMVCAALDAPLPPQIEQAAAQPEAGRVPSVSVGSATATR